VFPWCVYGAAKWLKLWMNAPRLVNSAISPHRTMPTTVMPNTIACRRSVRCQPAAIIPAASRNMIVPTTNSEVVFVASVWPQLTQVGLFASRPIMLKPGASPTLMNAVAKNALERNSDTIQQVEEMTPTAG